VRRGERMLRVYGDVRYDADSLPGRAGDRVDGAPAGDECCVPIVESNSVAGMGASGGGLADDDCALSRLEVVGEFFRCREAFATGEHVDRLR